MFHKISSKDRFFSDFGWLKTFWLFSFSHYYDPENTQFGGLRVYNDDVVEPGQGFGTHPHENMEIITVVLRGAVTHKDSMGNETTIQANEVQRMSAGTGITHSEYNDGEEPVHFHQIWFLPEEQGVEPSYEQKQFQPSDWHNKLFPIASGLGHEGAVSFGNKAAMYRCALEEGKQVRYEMTDDRKIFIYMIHGDLLVNGKHHVSECDQLRVDLETELELKAQSFAEFILIDAFSCKGWGYSDQTLKGKEV